MTASLAYRRMRDDHVFHLAGEDVEAARDDHVLLAIDDAQEPIGIADRDVAGVQPAPGKSLPRFPRAC